ncbi:aldehyde ferredoxin oxidoreductase family protein [Candidatus Aerophobetes bacterium]|nr:aldehyde ferredoxin oxidoreductase family protein [Candidatus Aerophobetes bacterium]
MYGFHNKILNVDLTGKKYWSEEIPESILKSTLGGRGLGAYLLWKNLKPGTDPLSPENVLIFVTGPATATKMMGAGRHGIISKSPLTGYFADSYSGGFVAPQIKKTGYDAILIKGASSSPVYLEISDTTVKFHDATHLWGKDTYETEDAVLKEVGVPHAQAVVIGPAGENLVAFACVENNYWRSAGRCGMGAVMGSKKLKAIVFHGEKECQLANDNLLNEYVRSLVKKGKGNPGVEAYRKYGTPQMVAILNKARAWPSEYWSKGAFEEWERLSADTLLNEFEVKPHACYRCFMACGKISKVLKGRHEGLQIEGPEHETIYAFGGQCRINSLEEIAYLNDICDRAGIDTITSGNLIAFLMELSKRGRIKEKIEYGDPDKVAELLHKIVKREGIGDVLARGIKYAAKHFNAEDIAVHVKGLDPAGFDPRTLKGMGLQYGTSPRGACHLTATFYKPELAGIIPPEKVEGKAKMLVEWEDRMTIFDTLILCRFFRDLIQWEDLITIIKATTGVEYTTEKLKKMANDISTLRRMISMREGLTREDDMLPRRLFTEPRRDDGKVVDEKEYLYMLDEYYNLRGWDKEGNPIRIPEYINQR